MTASIKTTGKTVSVTFTSKNDAKKFASAIKVLLASKVDDAIDITPENVETTTVEFKEGKACWILVKNVPVKCEYIKKTKKGHRVEVVETEKKRTVKDDVIFKTKKAAKQSLKSSDEDGPKTGASVADDVKKKLAAAKRYFKKYTKADEAKERRAIAKKCAEKTGYTLTTTQKYFSLKNGKEVLKKVER